VPEIEFVDPDPDQGDDEELVAGRPHREWSSRTKRVVRIGAAAVLTVVAGSVLVAVLQHHDGSTPAAAPTLGGANILAPEAPSGAFRIDHLGADAPEGARPGTLAGRTPTPSPADSESTVTTLPIDLSACPDPNACTTDLVVPSEVTTALKHAFPTVTEVRGSDAVVDGPHPTLRARNVTATVGALTLSVVIHPATRYDHAVSAVADNAGTRIVYARTLSSGLAVTVSVSGAPTSVPSLAKVKALAADRRLLAVD
jgi:hypothetical protein